MCRSWCGPRTTRGGCADGAAGPGSVELADVEIYITLCPGCSLHVIFALLVEIASGERGSPFATLETQLDSSLVLVAADCC